MKRPPDRGPRSQAGWAGVGGAPGKARAMAVPRPIRCVAAAARARGRKGSWAISLVHRASKPSASAACVALATWARSLMSSQASNCIGGLLRGWVLLAAYAGGGEESRGGYEE